MMMTSARSLTKAWLKDTIISQICKKKKEKYEKILFDFILIVSESKDKSSFYDNFFIKI